MRYLYIAFLLFLFININSKSVAQQKKVIVRGTVIDKETGTSIPGVTILLGTPLVVVGTTNGDGEFSVPVTEGASLTFRYLGYKSASRKTENKGKMTVALLTENNQLKETVIIGYQTKTKEVSTGSSTVISGKAIQDVPVGNIMELLQGKVSGLNIQNNNGSPGMRGSITLRGLSNINISGSGDQAFLTPTSPLFVIDGVPIEDNSSYEYGFQQAGPGISPISLIPQEDIERIEVLKDAQATSLYGSRGAYGVILVTTKRGNSKVPVIRYTTNFFVNTVPKLRSVIGGKGERLMRIDQIIGNDTSYYHALNLVNSNPILSDSLNAYWNNNTDWQSYFYRKTFNQTHNLDISGGDQLFNYKVNLGYYNEKGIVENTGFTRYNLNMNMQYQPSSRFKLFASISNAIGKNSKGSGNGLMQTGVASGGSSSSLLPPPSQFTAVNAILGTLNTQNDNKTVNVVTNLDLQYEFVKGLRASTTFSYNYKTGMEDNFKPAAINDNSGEMYAYNDKSSTLYNRNMLSYVLSIGEHHNFNAYVFSEMNMNSFKADATKQVGTVNDHLQGPLGSNWYLSRGGTLNNAIDRRSVAFASAFSYNYDQKYVLDLTYRLDGTSTNGPDAGYSKNPSIGLRWNFNKEDFLAGLTWMDFGSLRFSYGSNIQPVGTIYDVYGRYSSGPNYNGNPTVQADLALLPNEQLVPTTTSQLNGGFELGILKNKFQLNFDAYYKQVDNLLRTKQIPNINSYAGVSTNETSLVNYGYEFSLTTRPLSANSKLNWTLSGNFAINHDVMAQLPNGVRQFLVAGGTTGQAILYRLGMNSLSNVLLNTKGVYATDGDVPVDPLTGLRYRTGGNEYTYFQGGDPRWTDLNGDYILDDNDYVVAGNSQPKVVGGINSFMQYKNFSLNLNFSFTLFRDILNNASAARFQNFGSPTTASALVPLEEYNYWKQSGDNAAYPNPYDFTRQRLTRPFRYDQTLFQEDGSYIKFNDLTLSYNIDKKLMQRFGVNSIRVYGSARNIYTFSNYSGPNPESVTDLGRDSSGGYPNSRSYNLGINVMF